MSTPHRAGLLYVSSILVFAMACLRTVLVILSRIVPTLRGVLTTPPTHPVAPSFRSVFAIQN